MTLDEIKKMWEHDCEMDEENLVSESLKIAKLHSKYSNILLDEMQILNREQENIKNLEMNKNFYYQGKLDKSVLDKLGWKPFGIQLPKSDVGEVVKADEDVIARRILVLNQLEKAKFVESIIKSVNQRSYVIRTMVDYMKFKAGIN
jgi:hypothetical protein